LLKFYKDNGIKYIKIDYQKYSKKKNQDDNYPRRFEFCKKLALAKYEGREIIYVD
jgi:hypothetical protein